MSHCRMPAPGPSNTMHRAKQEQALEITNARRTKQLNSQERWTEEGTPLRRARHKHSLRHNDHEGGLGVSRRRDQDAPHSNTR